MRYSMINCLILSFLSIETLYSQVEIVSVYPSQNYLTAPRETDLYAVFNLDLDESTVVDTNIVVFAERTGTHFGNLSYDAGSRTLTFDPDDDFIAGERVRVTLTNKIKSASGESFRGFTWHFTVETFASGELKFVYRGDWGAGGAISVYSSDFNRDGYPDIIAVDAFFHKWVYLYLNNQNGGFYYFGTIVDLDTTDLSLMSRAQILDINRDGWPDIYVPGSHIFVINQGDGEFNVYQDTLLFPRSFGAVTDFDNDGNLDIVIATSTTDSLLFYRGLGSTGFELAKSKPLYRTAHFLTPDEDVFDLNNDGLIDIITLISVETRDSISVMINDKDFSFKDADFYDPETHSIYGQEYTNDMDGDGDLDYVLFGHQRSNSAKFLFYNDGNGTLTYGDYQPPQKTTGSVFGGDIDADGDIDLISAASHVVNMLPTIFEGHIYIFENNYPDSLSIVNDYLINRIGDFMRAILVDYDLDGDLDIIGIGYYVFWMENTSILSTRDDDDGSTLPEGYALHQNYPNPFNATTTISYQLPASAHVNLKIYDISGREVITLVNKTEEAGRHQVRWNGLDRQGKEVSSGIFFLSIKTGWFIQTRKIVVLR